MSSALTIAWQRAAEDLQIGVTAPFFLESKGQRLEFGALVHSFGSSKGMLLFENWSLALAEAASSEGYGYSCISGGLYDRESTIEVLRDWGWSGSPQAAPPWFSAYDPRVEE